MFYVDAVLRISAIISVAISTVLIDDSHGFPGYKVPRQDYKWLPTATSHILSISY